MLVANGIDKAMLESRSDATFAEILNALRQLAGAARTGTLFITTDDNHAARIVLESGKITAIGYSHLHGYDALPRLQQIKRGSYRFVDGGFISMQEVAMPETGELLSMLGGGAGGPAPGSATKGQSPRHLAHAQAYAVIERELTRHLGPIAGMICEDYVEDNGELAGLADAQRMLEAMAEEIDDASSRQQFVATATDVLRQR